MLLIQLLREHDGSSSQSSAIIASCIFTRIHRTLSRSKDTHNTAPSVMPHITSEISRAINNCHRNRGCNVCWRTSGSFSARGEERLPAVFRVFRHPSPSLSLSPQMYMNSHTSHVRAVRAGVSLYKTAVPSVAILIEEKETEARRLGFSQQRWGTGAPCTQTGGYVAVQMSPCGARIMVTYEEILIPPRAHRPTSLVMRLLFPSRRKLPRGKKGDIARPRVSR